MNFALPIARGAVEYRTGDALAHLDPFGGSGTTGLVASRLGRSATLIELKPEYVAMARARIESDAGR